MKVIAIIPAAGSGSRMGASTPKQFLELGGRSILDWTLENLNASGLIEGICLVVPPDRLEEIRSERGGKGRAVRWIVPGGAVRQASVANGFESITRCDVVLVHDAVRPFIDLPLIRRVIETAERHGSAVPGLPSRETLKEVGEDKKVRRTIDRRQIWSVQTPQGFRYDVLGEALRRAHQDGFVGTDEAMLVERTGEKVVMVEGNPLNLKITLPEDLIVAEAILHARRNRL